MGRVGHPYGVRGWLRIQTFSETLDGLTQYPQWWLSRAGVYQPYALIDWQIHSGTLVVALQGVDDRTQAEALRGVDVVVPRDALPDLAQDEYYWSDLIGLAVINRQEESLGVVSGFLESAANPVLVVQDGPQKRLIPFVDPVLYQVDLSRKQIVVNWGLDF